MRFDLEIPSNNTGVAFIREGYNIPNNIVPLLYHNNNSDVFPSDFISAKIKYYPKEFILGGYEVINGPEIKDPRSDSFILTNIVKYSSIDGKEIPLFYKHIIDEPIQDSAIRVIDSIGVPINKDLYTVKTKTNTTEIYINEQDKSLFVEYVTSTSVKKKLLNLRQIFEEAAWGDINSLKLPENKYIYRNNIIITSCDDKIYIAYKSDTRLFRKPYGNIEEPWYAGILNANFKINKNGTIYKYWIPEFYLQDLDTEYRYKLVTNKKCKKIIDGFIKTEYPIAKNYTDNLVVLIYESLTNKLKYIYTTNESLIGKEYSDGVFYSLIEDFTYNGIISLPIKLEQSDVAYATFYTDEEYYEYNNIDLKNTFSDKIEYIAIFIKPNVIDTDSAISHVTIGSSSTADFKTISEYDTWADNNNYYTASIITLINPYIDNSTEYIPITIYGNKINKYNASKIDIDILYNDIINRDIILPTNDSLIANINLRKYIDNGMVEVTKDSDGVYISPYGAYLISKINDIISNNLDASTYPILELNTKEY